jgi:hypothetical protein
MIEPLRELAGMASARRMESGKASDAAAAPADVVATFRKCRRLLEVIVILVELAVYSRFEKMDLKQWMRSDG